MLLASVIPCRVAPSASSRGPNPNPSPNPDQGGTFCLFEGRSLLRNVRWAEPNPYLTLTLTTDPNPIQVRWAEKISSDLVKPSRPNLGRLEPPRWLGRTSMVLVTPTLTLALALALIPQLQLHPESDPEPTPHPSPDPDPDPDPDPSPSPNANPHRFSFACLSVFAQDLRPNPNPTLILT